MNRFVFMLAMCVVLCAAAASAETVWDAVNDFGVGAQPENGVWRYGYGVGATGFGGYFDLSFGTDTEGGWTRSQGGSPDYSPYMWCNKTGTGGTYPAYSLNLSSGEGGDDYHTFVRWIAPADGTYKIDSCYQMMAAAGGGYWSGEMDVSTVVNGSVIYADFVSGYDYYSLHPEWGWPTYSPGPKTYSATYYLTAGSTVDFVAGIGWVDAGSDFANIAGCRVTAVPEPATLALFGSGLVGLLAFAWRKRK
jgi:hypothetical protein